METVHEPESEIHALLIEDDDVDRERLVRMLHRCARRIVVQEAPSKTEALNELHGRDVKFSFIFLDFRLEDGDGRDLLPDIWESVGNDCVVVAVTGAGTESAAAEAIKLGIHDYLSKGDLTNERVAETIEEGLKWRAMQEEIRRAEAELRHKSLHDPLTDLHNRHVFLDRLEHNCTTYRRDAQPFAVMMIDLDRFKDVNDQFGHGVGDRLLVDVANRLRGNVREVDTVARLGGDEFAIILEDVANPDTALALGRKLVTLLEQPFPHDIGMLRIGASVGIALCPRHGCESATLLRRADSAMYRAKRGIDKALLHEALDFPGPDGDRDNPDTLTLLSDIEQALKQGDITWYWQPKVDLRDRTILGFEALARWHHPKRGMIPPDRFVAAIEQSRLLPMFTLRSLSAVLEQLASVRDMLDGPLADVSVSVNISARMLEHGAFVNDLTALLHRYAINPRHLMLELTETALIGNPVQAGRVVAALQEKGIDLAIDDFGAGFTSFNTLRAFAVREIKIDKSYILSLGDNQFDLSLVRSLVVFCQSLDISLLAEGVETEACWQTLLDLGCTAGQGYGISRPMPFGQVREWVDRWKRCC